MGSRQQAPSVGEFKRTLQEHGEKVQQRLSSGQSKDAAIFRQVENVIDGRFYERISDRHYRITDDGLSLALALYLVDDLRLAVVVGSKPSARLHQVLEPIRALDLVSDVLLAAWTVVARDDSVPEEVVEALVEGVVDAQNHSHENIDAIRRLMSRRVNALLSVVVDRLSRADVGSDERILAEAVFDSLAVPHNRARVARRLSQSLRCYTLDPDCLIRGRAEGLQKYRDQLADRIRTRVCELSNIEQSFRSGLYEESGRSYARLHSLTFRVLAVGPLQGHVDDLVAWAFSNALTDESPSLTAEFSDLVSMNRIDWSEVKVLIREKSLAFRGPSPSRVARRAFMRLLYATGDSGDAAEARAIANGLEIRSFPGWRRVEAYCESDPCDPESSKSPNVDATLERFLRINVSKLFMKRFLDTEDAFLRDVTLAMARFAPAEFDSTQRSIVQNFLERDPELEDSWVFELYERSPLVEARTAQHLVEMALRLRFRRAGQGGRREHVVGLMLAAAIHALPPDARSRVYLDLRIGNQLTMGAISSAWPVDTGLLRGAVSESIQADRWGRAALLTFILLEHGAEIRRQDLEALLIEGGLADREARWAGLLAASRLAKGRRKSLLQNRKYLASTLAEEARFRPEVAVAAIDERVLAPTEAFVGLSDARWVDACRCSHALRSLSSEIISAKLGVRGCGVRTTSAGSDLPRNLYTPPRATRVDTTFAFGAVSAESVYPSADDRLDRVIAWAEQLASGGDFSPFIGGFALAVAVAVSGSEPDLALRLYERYSRREVASSKNPLDESAIYNCWVLIGRQNRLDLAAERFENAQNDHQIASEVVLSNAAGASGLLRDYVRREGSCTEPSRQARSLMAAGFGLQIAEHDEILDNAASLSGLLAEVRRAAAFAYDRNDWAKHWYSQMARATEASDFYRYSLLFAKTVDARFLLWHRDIDREGDLLDLHSDYVWAKVQKRLNSWKRKREATLFGDKLNQISKVVRPSGVYRA